jgi:hypothetical protein
MLNRIRETPIHAHRVWRWLKLAALGSPRAHFGHSSTAAVTLGPSRRQPTFNFPQPSLNISRLD